MEIENMTITHPMFMWIDYLRMFVDPLLSGNLRWEKAYKRFYLLQKYYPIKQTNKPLKFKEKTVSSKFYDTVISFLKENKSLIAIGQIAYNAYVSVCKPTQKFITKIPITEFEVISTDYINDVKNAIQYLQSNGFDKIKIQENYPFFQFTGFCTTIIDDGIPRFKIYDYNKICLPFMEYEGFKIGSFHLNLMRVMVNAIYSRVNENKEYEQMFFEMASHEIIMRRDYLNNKEQNFLDNSLFRDFNTDCIGYTQDPKIERLEEMQITKGRGRFDYHPEGGKKLDPSNWVFKNSSGNIIKNVKNYKIDITPDIHVEIIKDEKDDKSADELENAEKPSVPRAENASVSHAMDSDEESSMSLDDLE
jgi:hypothetical protein